MNPNRNNIDSKIGEQVKQNLPYILLQKLVTPLLNLFISVIIMRKLSVDSYGIYNVYLALIGYITLFGAFGIPSVLQRFLPEFYSKDKDKFYELSRIALLLCPFVTAVLSSFVFIFPDVFMSFFKLHEAISLFKYFVFFMLLRVEIELFELVFVSGFFHKFVSVGRVFYVIIRGISIYVLLSRGYGLIGLIGAEILSIFLQFVFYGVLYYRKLRIKLTHTNKYSLRKEKGRLLRYAFLSYFNEMGARILDVSTDFLVISSYLGASYTGLYAFANKVMQLAQNFSPNNIFRNIIRPAFFAMYVDSADRLNYLFNIVFKISLLFYFPLFLVIVVLGDKIILYFFDAKFLTALPVLRVVAFFYVLNSFQFPLGLVVQSIEKVQANLFSKVFSIYNLVADIVVIKYYGILGVAAVTGSAILLKNLFIYFYVRKYIHLKIDIKYSLVIVFHSLILFLLSFLERPFIRNDKTLLIAMIVNAIFYLFLITRVSPFSQIEKASLYNMLPGLIGKYKMLG